MFQTHHVYLQTQLLMAFNHFPYFTFKFGLKSFDFTAKSAFVYDYFSNPRWRIRINQLWLGSFFFLFLPDRSIVPQALCLCARFFFW